MNQDKDTSHRKPFYGNHTVQYGGLTFDVVFGSDTDMDAPWDNGDGYGIVSEWTTRGKKAGEIVLSQDRRAKRYFDWAGTVKKARAEGWNTAPYDLVETAGERAVRATQANFKYLKAWCDDEWNYVNITVTCRETGADYSCGGVETYNDYDDEHAWGMIEQLAEQEIKAMIAASEVAEEERVAAELRIKELQLIAEEFWAHAQDSFNLSRYTDGMRVIARDRFNVLCAAAGVQVK